MRARLLTPQLLRLVAVLSLSMATLIGCGGGGGGSDGGTSNNGQAEGVRVLHGALDADPVMLRINSIQSAQLIRFGLPSSAEKLSVGPNLIEVLTANGGAAIGSLTAEATRNSRYSILLYGSLSHGGLSLALIDETPPDGSDNIALVRVVHGLFGAPQIGGLIGDQQLAPLSLGGASPLMELTPGPLVVELKRLTDNRSVSSLTIDIAPSTTTTIFLAGEIGIFDVSKVMTTSNR